MEELYYGIKDKEGQTAKVLPIGTTYEQAKEETKHNQGSKVIGIRVVELEDECD